MTILFAITSFVLLTLGITWSRSSYTNLFVKFILLILGSANAFFLFQTLGYIVKV